MMLAQINKELKSKPGTYILVLKADKNKDIKVGSLGELSIKPGYYLYVGSALGPGGVKARIKHHYKQGQSLHWHIDYLREHTNLKEVWYLYSQERFEHEWAKLLKIKFNKFLPRIGFGVSDCGCSSHLFFSNQLFFAEFKRQYPERKIRQLKFQGG